MTSPIFKSGMTGVTITRGKRKGETVSIETVSGSQVAVKHTDGTLSLQNDVSLKAPEVPTIDADTLREVFQESIEGGADDMATIANLVDRLEKTLPGFGASVKFS